ncbi:MAG: VOC family protein [Novosphingobium sp.]|nr:VOC family protein [Novosphingobium sp.]
MGVKELGYLVIEARDPVAWDSFLTEVAGVMSAGRAPDGAALYRIDERPFRFAIQASERDYLGAAGLEVSADGYDAMVERLRAAGRPVADFSSDEATARRVERAIRTSDPAGNALELYVGHATDDVAFVSPAGVSGFVTGALGLGHVVFAAPNFDECHRFYREVLGLGDTDLPEMPVGDATMRFAFMHAANGRHHSVALGEMPQPPSGCVHIMLEAKSMIDVGKAYDRMRRAGVPQSASLGKHVNDEMTSFYMRTPAGFDLEFGCEGLVIDPASWEATAHTEISVWGHRWSWQEAMEAAQGATP